MLPLCLSFIVSRVLDLIFVNFNCSIATAKDTLVQEDLHHPEFLSTVDWSFLDRENDINIACCQFYNTLNRILDIAVPKYRFTFGTRKRYPPWFDSEIKNVFKTNP